MADVHLQNIHLERPSAERLDSLQVESWPVWEKGVSEFSQHYDKAEVCYVVQGRAEVSSADGLVEVGEGDLVIFPEGLQCTWKVKSPVRKRYKSGTL
jgi:uncharacterized cupin superfamily protein